MSKISIVKPFSEPLPSPLDLIQELPANESQLRFIEKTRQEVRDILDQKDTRLLMITGPCSIHDTTAALEYATRLNSLAQSLSDSFLLIMRVYFEKPRTHIGWKGMLYDPHLDGSDEISTGLKMTRRLLLELAKMKIPTAAEFLDPASVQYFGDLISWGCIGARTAESQTHRQMASGLAMPVGFKNSTSGNVEVAVNGIVAASTPQTFMGLNEDGRISVVHTQGNTYGHVTLRGGEGKPNYDPKSIANALSCLEKAGLSKRVIVDCSHDNSNRKHEQQPTVFQSIINQIIEGNKSIRGLILESHLYAGNQIMRSDLSQLKYGVSITDPCLDWPSTEQLIKWAAAAIRRDENEETKVETGVCPDELCEAGLGVAGK
jgi:3-deoxy-7-phosphoheptulonate synthase